MTLQQFLDATGASVSWYKPISAAMQRFHIDTPLRQAHFLAQAGHESGGFRLLVENLNYSTKGLLATWPKRFNAELAERLARNPEAIANYVYAGRLGNEQPGDGWRYRGRGLFQLTGRANYRAAGLALALPLEEIPERAEQPGVAALAAAWFWSYRVPAALADNDELVAITRAINGGTLGLADRRARLERAKAALC